MDDQIDVVPRCNGYKIKTASGSLIFDVTIDATDDSTDRVALTERILVSLNDVSNKGPKSGGIIFNFIGCREICKLFAPDGQPVHWDNRLEWLEGVCRHLLLDDRFKKSAAVQQAAIVALTHLILVHPSNVFSQPQWEETITEDRKRYQRLRQLIAQPVQGDTRIRWLQGLCGILLTDERFKKSAAVQEIRKWANEEAHKQRQNNRFERQMNRIDEFVLAHFKGADDGEPSPNVAAVAQEPRAGAVRRGTVRHGTAARPSPPSPPSPLIAGEAALRVRGRLGSSGGGSDKVSTKAWA